MIFRGGPKGVGARFAAVVRAAVVVTLVAEFGGYAIADPPSIADAGVRETASAGRADAGASAAKVVPLVAKSPLFVSVSAIPSEPASATAKPTHWWIGVVVAGAIGVVFAVTVTAATLGGGGGGGGDPLFHGNIAPGVQRIP